MASNYTLGGRPDWVLPAGKIAASSLPERPEARNKPRDPAIDIARGLGVVLVVTFHLHLYLGSRIAEPAWLHAANDWLASVRMPLLFLISGTLASGVRTADWSKVSRRIATTAWLFLIWAPAYMLACKLYAPLQMLIEPRGEIWFIWALSILTALLFATRGIDRRLVMAAVLAVSLPIFFGKIMLPSYTQMFLGRYSMYFFLGALFRAELRGLLRAGGLGTAALIAAGGLLCWFHYEPLWPVENLMLSLAILSAVRHVSRLTPRAADKLAYLGRNTLPIYLLHGMVVRCIKHCIWYPVASPAASTLIVIGLTPVIVGLCLSLRRQAEIRGAGFLFELPKLERLAVLLPRIGAGRGRRLGWSAAS